MLKWALQKGYCVIPGSGNPEHMASNLGYACMLSPCISLHLPLSDGCMVRYFSIYGAELSEEDMARLDALKDHDGFFYMDMREGKAEVKDEP